MDERQADSAVRSRGPKETFPLAASSEAAAKATKASEGIFSGAAFFGAHLSLPERKVAGSGAAPRIPQAKAAELLGIRQSRVSDLIRGKWERFSIEMLITLATKAGMRISLKRAA